MAKKEDSSRFVDESLEFITVRDAFGNVISPYGKAGVVNSAPEDKSSGSAADMLDSEMRAADASLDENNRSKENN